MGRKNPSHRTRASLTVPKGSRIKNINFYENNLAGWSKVIEESAKQNREKTRKYWDEIEEDEYPCKFARMKALRIEGTDKIHQKRQINCSLTNKSCIASIFSYALYGYILTEETCTSCPSFLPRKKKKRKKIKFIKSKRKKIIF